MTTEIDKSIKLVFNEFQKSISEVPLEVYYQTLTADQFSFSGYQFNIKRPGSRALLDSDIWIEYNLAIEETAPLALRGQYSRNAANPFFPDNQNRTSLRGANVMQRATQNVNLQINNQTLNVRPTQWIDVLNRLYVSNDQAEHEFSPSGGRFDEGNHGLRTVPYLSNTWTDGAGFNTGDITSQLPNAFAIVNNNEAGNGNTHDIVNVLPWWFQPELPPNPAGDLIANCSPQFPHTPEYMNPGFESRINKFSKILRDNLLHDNTSVNNINDRGANAAFDGVQGADANHRKYYIRILERLPIPLFKMYSNDEIFGVIPNIVTMQIQGIFVSNMEQMVLRANVVDLGVVFNWTNIGASDCKLYLRWYTPPMSMAIPREIHIPYKKIVNWSKTISGIELDANGADQYVETDVSEYNISLEAIPDLLLIYMKYQPPEYNFITPDDYNLEIRDLNINIDNASGKVNQIQSIDLYNKWKKLLKHSDNKILNYEEWRRYCCVAALQPEDYGVRYGPGYSNMTILGVKFTARNWHSNPAIMQQAPEVLGGYDTVNAAVDSEFLELNITSIYYKNKLVLREDGSASQELTKIAADFDMMRPQEGIGGMGLGQAGAGMLNA